MLLYFINNFFKLFIKIKIYMKYFDKNKEILKMKINF